MRRKIKILIACLVAPVALLIFHVVGTLTFYKSIVPILSPVLPRPDGVPRTADASFNWKGFGLFWQWETEHRYGCARWEASKTINYSAVELISGEAGCKSVGLSLRYTRESKYKVISQKWRPGGGETCPFKITPEQLSAYNKLIAEAKKTAHEDIEKPILNQIETRISDVDGQALTTDGRGGCNDLTFSYLGSR
jgi:hypothetical protein